MIGQPYIALAGAVAIFFAGWSVNGWRLNGNHTSELAERDRQALVVAQQVEAIGRAANTAISEADTKAWKGIEDDKNELKRLRGCVAARTCGVRIITATNPNDGAEATTPRGVVNDGLELDQDVQRRVLDLRESIGEDAKKLEYLQEYAQQCWKATQGAPSEK